MDASASVKLDNKSPFNKGGREGKTVSKRKKERKKQDTNLVCVCVFVCVCQREMRERESKGGR